MRCVEQDSWDESTGYSSSEEVLNRYLDGLTGDEEDVVLFSHLSLCASCRRQLNAVLEFRRLTRGERFEVPPWTDQRLFKRIGAKRSVGDRRDSAALDRRWSRRTKVSVRSAAMALAIACTLLVLLLDGAATHRTTTVFAVQERVDFADSEPPDPVYVFYPGVIVEEAR